MSTTNHEESDVLQVEGIYSKGFGLAPKLVMQDPRLSAIGKAIYCYFCSYAGAGKIAFPKVTKIMSDLKISRDAFYTHFNPLKTYGFIKVEQTRISGKHSHNVYTLMDHVPIYTDPENVENKPFPPCAEIPYTVTPDTVEPDTATPDTVKPDTNNNSNIKNNRSKNNNIKTHPPYPPRPQAEGRRAEEKDAGKSSKPDEPPADENPSEQQNQSSENLMLKTGGGEDVMSSSQSKTLTDERFEEFWSAYPRKVGKAAANKAWKRLRPDTALFNRMLTAVNAARQTDQWQREAGRFVPNPLTWLNQGRWDDDYTPANQPSRSETKANGNALTRLMAKMEAEETARANEIWVDKP